MLRIQAMHANTSPIQLIALDLDGTLLNAKKELTPVCRQALESAADAGILIVPATGRFFDAMPEAVRALPFLRYAITINGAQALDIQRARSIYRAEIPCRQAIEIMSYLDALPVIYDCYMNDCGWMTRSFQQQAETFTPDPYSIAMIRELRRPVDELKRFLAEHGADVQKIQLFTRDAALRAELLAHLAERFEALSVSSSVPNNVEINNIRANKGDALQKLAAHLGIPIANTMAFGDGLNDISMIRTAGLGVAMGNAVPEVLAIADAVTASCDADGVAEGILRYCFV